MLSFGYWTTNFVEVQRAMASSSMSAARRSPIIGSFPKMFFPFIVMVPGMIAAVTVAEVVAAKASRTARFEYNNSLLYLMRDLLPNGMLGLAIAGLLASFMAGMAANISAFNTVFSYDLWQAYVVKDRPDDYYLPVGRLATVGATVLAIGTAFIASQYSNIMDYIQTLFGFFNAPLFATFILGMLWKRMTPAAGWTGMVAGPAAAGVVGDPLRGRLRGAGDRRAAARRPGRQLRRGRRGVLVDLAGQHGRHPVVDKAKPESELRGVVWSLTPKEDIHDATRVRSLVPEAHPLAGGRRWRWSSSSTSCSGDPPVRAAQREGAHMSNSADKSVDAEEGTKHTAGLFDVRFFIGALIGIYGVVLTLDGLLANSEADLAKTDGFHLNLVSGLGMIVFAAGMLLWQRLRPTVVDEAAIPDDDEQAAP